MVVIAVGGVDLPFPLLRRDMPPISIESLSRSQYPYEGFTKKPCALPISIKVSIVSHTSLRWSSNQPALVMGRRGGRG